MKLRERIGPDQTERIFKAINDALDTDDAPVCIMVLDQQHSRVSDMYFGMCDNCVDGLVHQTIGSAVAHGTLPEMAMAKFMGHKHINNNGTPLISNSETKE